MSRPLETSEVVYTGNALTVDFPIAFPWVDDADIDVTLLLDGETVATTQVDGVDYNLTGANNVVDGEGGTCTMVVAPPALSTLTISRTVPITQATNLRTSGPFSPAVHMAIADKLTDIAQQLDRRIDALEGLATLLDISTLTAARVDLEFTTDADAIEDTFTGGLVTVQLPAAFTPDMIFVGKVTGGAGGQEAVQVRDWSTDGTTLTVGFVTGLDLATAYTIQLFLVQIAVTP